MNIPPAVRTPITETAYFKEVAPLSPVPCPEGYTFDPAGVKKAYNGWILPAIHDETKEVILVVVEVK